MDRIMKLSFILVFIILISTVTGTTKEKFAQIDDENRKFSNIGITSAGGCTDINRGTLSLSPNLMDLFASGYIKPELITGLQGRSTIYSRSCTAPSSQGCPLVAQMDSNKKTCTLELNGQNYKFMRACVNLTVFPNLSSKDYLVIKADKEFEKFIFLQPVFFHVGRSKAYSLNFGSNPANQFIIRNFAINDVNGMERRKYRDYMRVNIIQVRDNTDNLFTAHQTQDIDKVMYEIRKGVERKNGWTGGSSIKVPFVIFYLNIVPNYANIAKLDNNTASINISSLPYFVNKVQQVRGGQITNPALTVRFRFRISPQINEMIANNWISLLTIANRDTESWCNYDGRGILLVEAEPWYFRKYAHTSIYDKSMVRDNNIIAIDFTGVEKANDANINWCGWYNRLRVFLPVDVDIDISYVVSQTMKVVFATYYSKEKNERKYVFIHQNNCGYFNNDLINTIKRGDVMVNNVTKAKYSHLGEGLKISNVEVSYGVGNLHEWYQHHV
jgi:hypothetical protein